MQALKRKEIQLSDTGSVTIVEKKAATPKGQLNGVEMFSEATGLGLSISLPMVVGAMIGVWLDKKYGLTPVCTLSLMLIGTGLGVYNLVRFIKQGSGKKGN